MNDQKVVFRKIHGRIVPIHIKKDVPAAVLAASGAAIAVAGGHKAFALSKRSADIENISRARAISKSSAQMSLFKVKSTGRLLEASKRLHRARNLALVAGAAIGGALISGGVQLAMKSHSEIKKDARAKELSSIAGGYAAGAAIAGTAYYRLLHPQTPVKEAIKAAFKLARNRKTYQYILKGI